MAISPDEWMKQAEYDLATAAYMHDGGRHFYSVFMCHLSIEKALKGFYWRKLGELPPKSHHLPSLMHRIAVDPPAEILDFLIRLNEAQASARYPDNIEKALIDFSPAVADEILTRSREVLKWIKERY